MLDAAFGWKSFFRSPAVRAGNKGGISPSCRAGAVPLLAAALIASCSAPPPPPEPPRPVRVIPAEFRRTASTVRYSGEIRARYETPLAFQVGGKIDRRLVEVGTVVRKGQLLASLDPADYRLAEAKARARLISAEAELDQARQDLKHLGTLRDKKLASPAAVNRRQASARAAEGLAKEARSAVDAEQRRLGHTQLRADHDGVITGIEAETGQVVAQGQPVLRLARPEQKEVVIAVPENRLDELREAGAIRVNLWARPERFLPGRIREISPGVEAVTRTFTVKIALPNADETVRLGLTAMVHVDHTEARPIARLPLTAVTAEGGQARVWVLDAAGQSVHPRAVAIAGYDGDEAKIVEGLKEGERVVTAGVHKLLDGQKVRVLGADRP